MGTTFNDGSGLKLRWMKIICFVVCFVFFDKKEEQV